VSHIWHRRHKWVNLSENALRGKCDCAAEGTTLRMSHVCEIIRSVNAISS